MSRILLIEDAANSREAMAKLLRLRGHETQVARNGAEAMVQIRRSTPDLVLLDHMMPEVDGLTFLAGVRRFPRWKDMPVIMFTAVHDSGSQTRAEKLGVKEYLVKAQVTPMQVIDHIERHLTAAPALP